jgi:radical SAM-linked protein
VADTVFRLRVVYGKTGRLRHLSHLEVARASERAVRRAGLEYALTQGFNRRMKVAFGPALPVGTAGLEEMFDLWLRRLVPVYEAAEALRRSSPEGLLPVGASYVPDGEPSLAAALTLADYEVRVEGAGRGPRVLGEALDDVMTSGSLEVFHKGSMKAYDLERCIPEGVRLSEEKGEATFDLTVRMGEWGALRPEALVTEVLRRAAAGTAAVQVTRLRLRREDVSDA